MTYEDIQRIQRLKSKSWKPKPIEYQWYHTPVIVGVSALLATLIIVKTMKKKKRK